VFPAIVGLGLAVSGLALALLGSPPPDPTEDRRLDWRTLVLMGAALAAYLTLYIPLGFPLASAAFFIAGAWILGSRRPGRDVLSAVVLVVVVYVVFTRLLGLSLPAGPLEEPMRQVLQG
jgi:putative tricarboxylic transport membrane protein